MSIFKNILLILLISLLNIISLVGNNNKLDSAKFEWLPLAAYDSDIGFGTGVKCLYLNPLNKNESYDLIVFASTKGERWARFIFSIPDFELRQGTIYDHALDLIIDYDLFIRNNYFGVGNNSKFEDKISYSKEPIDISLALSRGFTEKLILGAGLRFKTINNYDIDSGKVSDENYRAADAGRVTNFSWFANFRYDSRNSYINPTNGISIKAEIENTPNFSINDINYTKFSAELIGFYFIDLISSTLAGRLKTEWLSSDHLPLHMLLAIGGNRTLRGAPQDRYLDNSTGVANIELRFPIPIFSRLGGIAGLDAGRVWNSISEFNFQNWKATPAVGLRYYMDTFVVRADIGFSSECNCICFNIGHMF